MKKKKKLIIILIIAVIAAAAIAAGILYYLDRAPSLKQFEKNALNAHASVLLDSQGYSSYASDTSSLTAQIQKASADSSVKRWAVVQVGNSMAFFYMEYNTRQDASDVRVNLISNTLSSLSTDENPRIPMTHNWSYTRNGSEYVVCQRNNVIVFGCNHSLGGYGRVLDMAEKLLEC